MRKDYIKRVQNLHPDFVMDVVETTLRIHKKDGKAYPLRVARSVAKRWKSVFRYKVTLVLNYLEYLGYLEKRLEDVDEYKKRMEKYKGLYERGKRRVYFSPRSVSNMGKRKSIPYRKLSYRDLGIKHVQIEEYPV